MKQGNLELTLGDKILAILFYGAYACGNVVSLYLYVRYRTIIQTRADFYYTFIYSLPLIWLYHIPGFDKLPRVFKYTCNALALLYCAAGGLSVEYIGSGQEDTYQGYTYVAWCVYIVLLIALCAALTIYYVREPVKAKTTESGRT